MFFLFYLALFVLVARCIEPLRDAQCAVEDVEKANVEQLHSILMELIDTPFFRLFRVPLDRPCSYWNSTTPNHSAAASATEPDAGGLCSGGAAPGDDPFGVDVGAPPACSLERDGVPPSESAKRREVAWQPFSDAVDRTISRVENAALQHAQSTQPDCDDENLPTFWLDLCGAVDDSSASETADDYISLPKNPGERWCSRRHHRQQVCAVVGCFFVCVCVRWTGRGLAHACANFLFSFFLMETYFVVKRQNAGRATMERMCGAPCTRKTVSRAPPMSKPCATR